MNAFAGGLALLFFSLAMQPPPAGNPPAPAPKPPKASKPRKSGRPLVTIETTKGRVEIELYPGEVPATVQNFVELIRKGFYNGLVFHRVEEWVVQGGDPKGDGSGGPGYTIRNEPNTSLRHTRGAVGMANSGRDTAGSQFYIIKQDTFQLDSGQYTLFGRVVFGMEVIEKLTAGDKMTQVTVEAGAFGPTRRAIPEGLATPILPEDVERRTFASKVRVKVETPKETGPGKVTLVRGSGDDAVDAAIVEAIGAWRWSPALVNGEPAAGAQEFEYDLTTHSRRYDGKG